MPWGPLRTFSGRISTSAMCRHPRCTSAVHYRSVGRGRQQEFCSDACRVGFLRDRKSLLDSLAVTQDALSADLSPSERARFEADAKFLKWHLTRYHGSHPPEDQVDESSVMGSASRPHSIRSGTAPEQHDNRGSDDVVSLESSHGHNPKPAAQKIIDLANSADSTTRAWLARHPECPQEVLRAFSLDPDPKVRRSLASRRDLPPDVHRRLRRDRAKSVRLRVLATALD